MGCLRICLFVGSRANYGRLESVIKVIRQDPDLELKLIAGASALWEDIKADDYISCLVDGDTTREMALTSGLLHIQIVNILDRLKPDVIIVHGDRYEVLNVAQVASYMNIPIAHTEGGELTGTIDDKVRYAITALADYHFPVTELSASRIYKPNVWVVGSTAIDNIRSLDLTIEDCGYILVLRHTNTTDPEPIEPLLEALKNFKSLTWINPNVDAGSKHMLKKIYKAGFKITKGLSPEKYYELLSKCSILVGNTSSGIKEGSYLGKPYICIGTRQIERGTPREHDINTHFVLNNTEIITEFITELSGKTYPKSHMFGDGTAGEQIVKILKERL